MTIGCWLYDQIPGAWEKWILAVFAVNQKDADQYVKIYNGGGRRIGKANFGKVEANCGAVTPAAEARMFVELEIDA